MVSDTDEIDVIQRMIDKVLILLLMEYGLGHNSVSLYGAWFDLSLNPSFNGIWSRTVGCHEDSSCRASS